MSGVLGDAAEPVLARAAGGGPVRVHHGPEGLRHSGSGTQEVDSLHHGNTSVPATIITDREPSRSLV